MQPKVYPMPFNVGQMVIFKDQPGDELIEMGMVIGYPMNFKLGSPVMEIQRVVANDRQWKPYRELFITQMAPTLWPLVYPFNSAEFCFEGSVDRDKVQSLSHMRFADSRSGQAWVVDVGTDFADHLTTTAVGLQRLYTCLTRYADYLKAIELC